MRPTGTDRTPDRHGFTIVELAIVLTIASILIGVAVPRITDAFRQREVNGVRDGIVLLAVQARARAMERARTVEFHLDTNAGIAAVIDAGNSGLPAVIEAGDTIDALRFEADVGVTAAATPAHITLCYTPRGFATLPCSTTLSGPTEVVFSRGDFEAPVEIWQLGQLRKP